MSDTETVTTGQLLGGRYRVGRPLGRGGMGAVYEAVQEDLHRRVAIKVLHPHLTTNHDVVARFRREAEAAAALGHPNIIAVTDFHWGDGEPAYLVMEFVAGEPLSRTIETQGPLAGGRAAFIATQVLSALGAAHAAGIVHRDLKPDNIFLTSVAGVRDIVKLLDFGIAKLAEPGGGARGSGEASHKLTATGTVLGTPYYMSPEQARGRVVDARSDLYTAGVVLYEALTGRLPFRADNYNALLFAITDERPPPLAQLRPDVPPGLVAVVERAMAKDPAARFASADEFARALEPFSQASVVGASGAPHLAHHAGAQPSQPPAGDATAVDTRDAASPLATAPTVLPASAAPSPAHGALPLTAQSEYPYTPPPFQPAGFPVAAPQAHAGYPPHGAPPFAAASHPPSHPPRGPVGASSVPPTPMAFSGRPMPPSLPVPAPPAAGPYRPPMSLPKALALVGVALFAMCAISRGRHRTRDDDTSARLESARRTERAALEQLDPSALLQIPARVAAALDAGVPLSAYNVPSSASLPGVPPVPAVPALPAVPGVPELPGARTSGASAHAPREGARAGGPADAHEGHRRATLGSLGGSARGVYTGSWSDHIRPLVRGVVERCLSLPGYNTRDGHGFDARLRIGPLGHVQAIQELRPSSPQPPGVTRCVTRELRGLDFGPPDNGVGGVIDLNFSEQH